MSATLDNKNDLSVNGPFMKKLFFLSRKILPCAIPEQIAEPSNDNEEEMCMFCWR